MAELSQPMLGQVSSGIRTKMQRTKEQTKQAIILYVSSVITRFYETEAENVKKDPTLGGEALTIDPAVLRGLLDTVKSFIAYLELKLQEVPGEGETPEETDAEQ